MQGMAVQSFASDCCMNCVHRPGSLLQSRPHRWQRSLWTFYKDNWLQGTCRQSVDSGSFLPCSCSAQSVICADELMMSVLIKWGRRAKVEAANTLLMLSYVRVNDCLLTSDDSNREISVGNWLMSRKDLLSFQTCQQNAKFKNNINHVCCHNSSRDLRQQQQVRHCI